MVGRGSALHGDPSMIKELATGLGVTLENLFKKPFTVQYPDEKLEMFPRFRGRHILARHEDGLERCVGCELCAVACPADAIFVKAAEKMPEDQYNFKPADGIETFGQRVAHIASLLSKHGVIPVVALISPYRRSRDFARSLCPRFVEVHVATPLEVCERRDVKGLYQRARQGLIHNFTGIDDVYEPPLAPEVRIDTRSVEVEEAIRRILAAMELPGS